LNVADKFCTGGGGSRWEFGFPLLSHREGWRNLDFGTAKLEEISFSFYKSVFVLYSDTSDWIDQRRREGWDEGWKGQWIVILFCQLTPCLPLLQE